MADETIETVFRDAATFGVPSSGSHKPVKKEIRNLLNAFLARQTGANAGALIQTSKAALDGLSPAANTMAWVIGDADPDLDGVYQRSGSSWVRRGPLPYGIIHLNNEGAGTANAIQVTTAYGMPDVAFSALYELNVTAANTGAVTVSINGAAAVPLVNGQGGALVAGTLQPGMAVLVVDDGTNLRMLTDGRTVVPGASGQFAGYDGAGNLIPIDPPDGGGNMNTTFYDPNGIGTNVFNVIVPVADRAALAAINPSFFTQSFLKETGYGGVSEWDASDLSAAVTWDSDERFFIPPASAPTGASGAWVRRWDGIYRPEDFGALGAGSLTEDRDTAAIQAMWDELPNGARVQFMPGKEYCLGRINAPITRKTVHAYGAKFFLTEDVDGLFDLNPDADPANVESTAKSYGYWYGGEFSSVLVNPSNAAAFRALGIRQMRIEDTIIGGLVTGQPDDSTLASGIVTGGLGGHLFRKNRFLRVGVGINAYNWGGATESVSTALTTVTFEVNEFILAAGQKAIFCDTGYNDWRIIGGFMNGSEGAPLVHMTNRNEASFLTIDGVGFEQAAQNGQFLYLEDTHAHEHSDVTVSNVSMTGDPAGGGFTAMKFERVRRAKLSRVNTSALVATGNASLDLDANCSWIEIDATCRMMDPALVSSAAIVVALGVDRTELYLPSKDVAPPFALSGYNGNAFSTTTATLNMSSLITGNRYPKHGIQPKGYTLLVQARDSDSAGTASRMVEFGRTSSEGLLSRNVIDLDGVQNDRRVQKTFYQPAHTDGSIWANIVASGAGTLDMWIYVLKIHM